MRVHLCGHRGCREKLPLAIRYCDKHKSQHQTENTKRYYKQYNSTQRDQEANAFYQSKQWTKMRTYVYSRDMGTCQCCGNVITDRKIVDHIHPLSIAPDEKLNSYNLWTLCYECHNVKTMIEQQVLNSPNGKNKASHVSKEWYKKRILSYRTKQRSVAHNEQTNTN